MQQLLDTLLKVTPTLTPKLRVVAKLILDNPNLVATTSMRALAGRAGVTPPTMIRFANTLGFENYVSFRRVFQTSVNEQDFEDRANWLQLTSATDGMAAIVQQIAESGLGNMKQFFKDIDLDEVSRAADIILAAPNVYVVAAGGVHWIASYLHYVCKMAIPQMRLPRTSGSGLIEGLIPVCKGDVILTLAYHPYSSHGIEASEFALARGARLIYLTDSKAAPLASRAEVLILQKTESPQFFPSMVAVMVAIETLISVIVARSGEAAIRSIADYSDIRDKSDFYIT
ncbi:MAG: MurR/RpiR family transcriptional regulator [Gammaproteobacteria bacterium]|nr:MurR/RpiR family transcriptional regulator [Gammaproteobacteria bacterium]